MASRFLVPLSRGSDPLLTMYREMNRMFDDVFSGAPGAASGRDSGLMSMPSLDVQEKEGELQVAVELPGVRADDVDVRLERDVLTISGEKKVEGDPKASNYHLMERSYGRFTRSMQLPFTPDPSQVIADFEHGVLKIRLQRHAQQQASQRIQVRSKETTPAQPADRPNEPSSRAGGAGSAGTGGYDVSAHYGAGRDAAPPSASVNNAA